MRSPYLVVASIMWHYPAMDLDEVINRYHRALDKSSRGDPVTLKALYSEAEDVALANPFGPARRGRQAIVEALDYAFGTDARGQGHRL